MDDADRTAILRRRQRLIALALSGLTSAAGCDEPPAEPPSAVVEREVAAVEEPREAPSEPSAEVVDDALDEEPAPEPYEPDPAEVRHAEDAKRRWRERAIPRPCLSRLPPQACLSVLK